MTIFLIIVKYFYKTVITRKMNSKKLSQTDIDSYLAYFLTFLISY